MIRPARPRATGRRVARLLELAALALVLSSCAAAPDCDRIPGVRPGVCPLPAAEGSTGSVTSGAG